MTKFACSLPWTGFSNEPNGKAQPCCLYKGYITNDEGEPMYVQQYTVDEILHSKFMKNLRQEFRDGKKPIGCSTCWTDEDNGYDSKRIIYNTKINHDPVVEFTEEPTHLSEFQLIINNSCNLKCRSCTPSHSTQWQAEYKILTGDNGYPMPYQQSGDQFGKLWIDRHNWYKHLRRLEVVGGEPFYVKQWHQMFYELIEYGYSKDIDITLTTNCTLFYEELIYKLANNFKSVSIGLSIDGMGSTYEYLRHPGKWFVAYENMKRYYQIASKTKLNVQVNITISWLNAYQIPELHQLIYDEFPNFSIWNNIVHYPLHLPLYSAPQSYKDYVSNLYNNFAWKPEYKDTMNTILNFMNSKTISQTELENNLKILYNTDKFRKENLTESIPILKQFIN